MFVPAEIETGAHENKLLKKARITKKTIMRYTPYIHTYVYMTWFEGQPKVVPIGTLLVQTRPGTKSLGQHLKMSREMCVNSERDRAPNC